MGGKEGSEDHDVNLDVSLQNKRESQQALPFIFVRPAWRNHLEV